MDRREFINGLRELASLLESRPEIPTPYSGSAFTGFLDGDDDSQRLQLSKIAKSFPSVDKKFGDYHAGIAVTFPGQLSFTIYANRGAVCERKVKTTFVPAKVIPATPEVTIPEHVEEVVTWDCKPLLGDTISTLEQAVDKVTK